MIFRVMKENEIEDKGLGKGIYSKKFDMNYYNSFGSFGNALDNITTHIVNGNRAETEYISCSKDFCLDLEKYATEQLDLRPYLALVSNHDESVIESDFYDIIKEKINLYESIFNKAMNERLTIEQYKDLINQDEILSSVYADLEKSDNIYAGIIRRNIDLYLRYPKGSLAGEIFRMPQAEVKKMVIDTSSNIYFDKTYKEFFELGLIHNKNGERKEKFNQWEYGTAKNSSEVLVLNHISSDDIQVLNPLQYDILYVLIRSFPFGSIKPEVIEMLDLFKEENYSKIRNLFKDSNELLVFDNLYVQRKSILNACETRQVFRAAIYYKREIIKKCIQYLNYTLNKKFYDKYIPTIDETIKLNECPAIELQGDKILKKVR